MQYTRAQQRFPQIPCYQCHITVVIHTLKRCDHNIHREMAALKLGMSAYTFQIKSESAVFSFLIVYHR